MTQLNEFELLAQNFADICREFDAFHKKTRQDNLSARLVYEQNINVLQRCRQRVQNNLASLKTAENDEMRLYYSELVKKSLLAFRESLIHTKLKVQGARPMPPFFY